MDAFPEVAPTSPPLPNPSLHVAVADEDLRISYQPGRSGHTVISFAGIGQGQLSARLGPHEEFARTLAGLSADADTHIFVVDCQRRWLNGIGARVVRTLRELTADQRTVVTLGNSMGGFAALWAAGQLPNCRRAVALAPQFSVHPDHMPRKESRWSEYRAEIRDHDIRHALDHQAAGVEHWAIFGESVKDGRHAALLKRHGGDAVHLMQMPGANHNTAKVLREAGVLSPLLEYLLSSGPVVEAQVAAMLDRRQRSVRDQRLEARAARLAAREQDRAQRAA